MAKRKSGKQKNRKNAKNNQDMTGSGFKAGDSQPSKASGTGETAAPQVSRFKLEVELLEDLHSGTGHTAGDLDGVQLKDRDDLAMISRGHLKGLLREIADELVALRHANPEDVNAVFGAPHAAGRGRLSITSLYQESREANFVEWTSTARKEDERGPLPDHLRTVEHVGAGTRFQALMEMVLEPGKTSLHNLLDLCCKRLVALGSGRRVGDGRVRTTKGHLNAIPVPFAVPYASNYRSPRPPSPGQLRLRLLLRTQDAACFPITGNPGNLIFSACYMAGSAHRGAWIEALSELGHDASWVLEDSGPKFLDAVPLPPNVLDDSLAASDLDLLTIEAIPIPLDHPTRKPPAQGSDDWPWWGEPEPVALSEDMKPKRPGEMEFLFRENATSVWTRYAPEMRVHLRNNTGDKRRRKLADQSLFSVEEIAERTDFLTELVFPDTAAAMQFSQAAKEVLEGRKWLKLGRGGAPAVVTGHLWMPPPVAPSLPEGHDRLSVVLTSDLILRGPRLGYLSRLTAQDILALAGSDQTMCTGIDHVDLEAKMDTTLIHGFNASSGLPRKLALAIRRGSTFTLTAPPEKIALIWQGLSGALARGLGERRQEGHGRFLLEPEPIADSRPHVADLPMSAEIEWRERAVAEGLELAERLYRKGSVQARPSKGQLEEFRRRIQRCETLVKIERQIELQAQHAATVGGDAWRAFDFSAMDRRRSDFGKVYGGWQLVVDTALRKLVRDAGNNTEGGRS